MTRQRHTIVKQVFELKLTSEAISQDVQEKIESWMGGDLIVSVEEILNLHSHDHETLIIDRLELDLGTMDYSKLKDQFSARFQEALSQQVREHLYQHGERKMTPWESTLTVFIHFLEYGIFPAWAESYSLEMLEKKVLAGSETSKASLMLELRKLSSRRHALERMVVQLSDHFNLSLIRTLYPALLSELSFANHMIPETFSAMEPLAKEKLLDELKINTLTWIWYHLLSQQDTVKAPQIIQQVLYSLCSQYGIDAGTLPDKVPAKLISRNILEESLLREETEKSRAKENGQGTTQLEFYYVSNSGLVLLWPYFEKFFDELGFLSEKTFKSKDHRRKAIMISQYLVTGEQAFDEFLMPLNKVLMGWPPERTFTRSWRMNRNEKERCNLMLKDFIRQWAALKNTSYAGLREAYLERDGKLVKGDGKWTLYVERKPYDVLLDKLPWPVLAIKLPWMEHPLNVVW